MIVQKFSLHRLVLVSALNLQILHFQRTGGPNYFRNQVRIGQQRDSEIDGGAAAFLAAYCYTLYLSGLSLLHHLSIAG